MKTQQDTELPLGNLQDGACQGEFVDPEWWVGEHEGYNHRGCQHQEARHICIAHCPVREACKKVAADNPDLWLGMVIAGELRTGRSYGGHNHLKPVAPSILPPTLQCHLCPHD
jgi:hypothetical protein